MLLYQVQYDRGVFYPGAFQFAYELTKFAYNKNRQLLSKTYSSHNSHENHEPPKVAVLTARAKELKFALALKPTDKLCSGYRETGNENGMKNWGIGQVYYGSVKEWIFQKKKGLRKFKNFEIMLKNDQKHNRINDYILIGDTGERDEDAGERIAIKYGPNYMKAIFLHVVTDDHSKHTSTSKTQKRILPQDRIQNGVPIFYFKTYVGAATKAFKNNLIGADGVVRVIERAEEQLQKLDKTQSESLIKSMTSSIPVVGINQENSVLIANQIAESRWHDLQSDIQDAKLAIK